MNLISNRELSRALATQGLLPENCRVIDVVIAANSAVVIRYEVMVDRRDIPRLIAALGTIPQRQERSPDLPPV